MWGITSSDIVPISVSQGQTSEVMAPFYMGIVTRFMLKSCNSQSLLVEKSLFRLAESKSKTSNFYRGDIPCVPHLLRRIRPWPVCTDEQRDRNRNIKNTGNPLKRRQNTHFTLNRDNVTVTDC
jgi:hypothetical protein